MLIACKELHWASEDTGASARLKASATASRPCAPDPDPEKALEQFWKLFVVQPTKFRKTSPKPTDANALSAELNLYCRVEFRETINYFLNNSYV